MQAQSNMKGELALVTGAVGALGRGTALKLAQAGADVFLVDSDRDGLAVVAREVQALGVKAHVHPTDITAPENCATAVATAVQVSGRLDALCNVANAFFPGRTTTATRNDWEISLAINLSAPFFLMQAAIPHLLKNNGAIVNVISDVAFMACAYTAAYTASRAGLAQMTKAVALEYIHEPIRINLVSPGALAVDAGSMASIPSDLDPSLFVRFSTRRGKVDLESVCDAIAFLASDASRGYHGTCLTIDNGVCLGAPIHN